MSSASDRHALRAAKGLVVAAVVAIIVALAVWLWPRSPGPRVVIVGDSITVFAHQDISHALGGQYAVTTSAVSGKRIDEMLPALQNDLKKHPRAVVLNLGTNDMLQARLHPDWQAGYDAMIAMVADVPCVVLTTISTLAATTPTPDPALDPQVASQINGAMVTTAATRKNVRVIDWNHIVHGPGGLALLIPDRIHPSDAGSRVLATEIRHALDAPDCAAAIRGRTPTSPT